MWHNKKILHITRKSCIEKALSTGPSITTNNQFKLQLSYILINIPIVFMYSDMQQRQGAFESAPCSSIETKKLSNLAGTKTDQIKEKASFTP